MQVEQHPESVLPTPFDEPVDEPVSGFDGGAELVLDDACVDGQADVVEAGGGDLFDVAFRDELFPEVVPEAFGCGAADEACEERLDLTGRFGAGTELPHVPLGQEPVAEADTAQVQHLAGAVDEVGAVAADESVEHGRASRERASVAGLGEGHGAPFRGVT